MLLNSHAPADLFSFYFYFAGGGPSPTPPPRGLSSGGQGGFPPAPPFIFLNNGGRCPPPQPPSLLASPNELARRSKESCSLSFSLLTILRRFKGLRPNRPQSSGGVSCSRSSNTHSTFVLRPIGSALYSALRADRPGAWFCFAKQLGKANICEINLGGAQTWASPNWLRQGGTNQIGCSQNG